MHGNLVGFAHLGLSKRRLAAKRKEIVKRPGSDKEFMAYILLSVLNGDVPSGDVLSGDL